MSNVLLLILALACFWVVPAWVCSLAAEEKGRSKWKFFFLALSCGPIIGFLAVIAFPVKSRF